MLRKEFCNTIGTKRTCCVGKPDIMERFHHSNQALSLRYIGVKKSWRQRGIFAGLMENAMGKGVPLTASVLHNNQSATADRLVKIGFSKVTSDSKETQLKWQPKVAEFLCTVADARGRLSRETQNEDDDYHGCKRCREPKQSQPGIGSLVHFPFAFNSLRRIRMDFTGRLRFAEITTHDFPALIRSSKRRSSSGVHLVPRCCTAIKNAAVFFLAVGPGRERANLMLSKRARLRIAEGLRLSNSAIVRAATTAPTALL